MRVKLAWYKHLILAVLTLGAWIPLYWFLEFLFWVFFTGEDEGQAVNNQSCIDWLLEQAHQGSDEGQFLLGRAYYNGEHVKKDDKEAVQWWRKAAEQGNSMAQYRLGEAYYNGSGIEKDDQETIKWWRMAAEQGHESARIFLEDKFKIKMNWSDASE